MNTQVTPAPVVKKWLPVRIPASGRAPFGSADGGSGECARCGHCSGGCDNCDRYDPLLGGYIFGKSYCHTYSDRQPSCYTLAMREQE